MEIPVCHQSSTPSGREEWNTKDWNSHLQKNLVATNILYPSVYFHFMKYVGIASKFLLVGRQSELKQKQTKTQLYLCLCHLLFSPFHPRILLLSDSDSRVFFLFPAQHSAWRSWSAVYDPLQMTMLSILLLTILAIQAAGECRPLLCPAITAQSPQ